MKLAMNTYSIIMVGPRGSGKTVFLASMYKKLSTQGDLGFFLTVDGQENSNYLHDIYTKIAMQKWPLATQASELSELTFTCKVQSNNLSNYAACNFTYIDYAGGEFQGNSAITSLVFTPDNKFLISANKKGELQRFAMEEA
jgi:predicted ATP-binding protein involved in virulence